VGFSNQYVRFEGTNEYATFGNILAFERTDSFSISCWFKTIDAAGGYLLGKMSGSTAYRGYGATYNANGSLRLILRNDNATTNFLLVTTTSTGWNNGAWHHVVWTYAGTSLASGVCCYVDGALQTLTVGTDALTATIVDTSSFWLGGANSASAGWLTIGSLDEVSVYSDVLTPTEVTWVYNSGVPRGLVGGGAPTGLVAWWRMGEGDTYPTLLDSSGSGYSGTMTNMESTDILYGGPGGIVGADISLVGYLGDRYYGKPAVVGGPSMQSKYFKGRPVMVCPLVGDEVPHYYKMRAQDSGSAPPGYVTWTTMFSPDFAGAGYLGGTPTPVGSMVFGSAVVADEWWEGED
jgi:hypothetical protein